MVDKVKPLKIETGVDTDYLPTETDPTEDYLSAKGVAIENNDNYLIDAAADGQIQYKDSLQTTYRKLNEIYNFSYHKIDLNKTVKIPNNQHMFTRNVEVNGFLVIDGGLILI